MKKIFFLILCLTSVLQATIQYEVNFVGLKDSATLREINSTSSLINLQKKEPYSINALRFRSEDDVPTLLQVLHNHGYLDATLKTEIVPKKENSVIVYVFITPGQRYRLTSYEILNTHTKKEFTLVKMEDLHIKLANYYLATTVLDARNNLLSDLAKKGYPLATISNHEIIGDFHAKEVHVRVLLDEGPLCPYGEVSMLGLEKVKKAFVEKNILWKKGEPYNATIVENVQDRLLKTDLFSSVMITHNNQLNDKKELPMKIDVQESKHRNISLGASYATVDGAGINFRWGHRNLGGMGEKLFLEGDLSQKSNTGKITFIKPDLFFLDQNFVMQAAAEREKIRDVYLAFMYDIQLRLDHQVDSNTLYSFGLEEELNIVHESIKDGKYWLFSLPSFVRYNTTKNLLDPVQGYVVLYHPIFYQILNRDRAFFWKQTLTTNYYVPFLNMKKLVFAFHLQLGSISGASLHSIPLTKLFFGGADDQLRGYRYHTVSPLGEKPGKDHKRPEGARGAIFFTFEPRFRITETLGIVPFFDCGCFTKRWYPDPDKKWYKSVGLGFRYFTFFGPLRLDCAFPLDRRAHFDPKYQIYVSIGQSF
jgi:translocation and assembly module TamA